MFNLVTKSLKVCLLSFSSYLLNNNVNTCYILVIYKLAFSPNSAFCTLATSKVSINREINWSNHTVTWVLAHIDSAQDKQDSDRTQSSTQLSSSHLTWQRMFVPPTLLMKSLITPVCHVHPRPHPSTHTPLPNTPPPPPPTPIPASAWLGGTRLPVN